MKLLRSSALLACAVLLPLLCQSAACAELSAKITVSPQKTVREISPMIYGVNFGVDTEKVSAKSMRLGGNRMTGYNWENNGSNAGSDYKNMSDMYMIQDLPEEIKFEPGAAALGLSDTAQKNDIPYTLLTLQMAGYVVSNRTGSVKEENAAPSEYWQPVVNRKGSEFSLTPDKTDGYVYTDEYMNYLFEKVGKSDSDTGFDAYALDNEPALWSGTHSLLHPEKVTCSELIERSVDLASTVKDMDANAEVFGPSLYGYYAYLRLQDAPDWEDMTKENDKYRWFIDCYLDKMHNAEQTAGKRLLDVLDIHYYTEAKGECGERSCNHYDNDGCIKARLDSVRSLYDPDYKENSWITDTGAEFFPLLPNIQQSIDTFYPETKLAFTEYDFGGGDHISGGVAQADTLGIFAEYGVYFASIWSFDNNEYQLAAINMFTNYDGEGSGFGDTLTESSSDLPEYVSAYSAARSSDSDSFTVIVTNRSIHEQTLADIAIDSEKQYGSAEVYSLYGDTPEIQKQQNIENISGNAFSYTLPPLSVTEFVITVQPGIGILPIIIIIAAAVVVIAAAVVLILLKKHKGNSKAGDKA